MRKRQDCFFGLHFDLHANEYSTNIGSDFDFDFADKLCAEVQPDFIQVDSKGHPGFSSYPTKIKNGIQAPNISKDILKIWRQVTAKYNIPLYVHHSGIMDEQQGKAHPEWAVKNGGGQVMPQFMSMFSEYPEKVLIPQLIEIANEYGINGAWVDGECWGVMPDYSENAKKAYGKPIPKPEEDGYYEYLDFLRKSFIKYVENYIKKVKAKVPDFEITSNWMNSTQMPEDVEVTDFISGDLWPTDCVDYARLDARMISSFNRTWDIMAWGFSFPTHYAKPSVQLKQEAASVIMHGGGFQVYQMQEPNKTLFNDWIVPTLKDVADFCKERKSFCHHGKALPEVGLIHSLKGYYHKKPQVFSLDGEYVLDLRGLLGALCDNQVSVEVFSPFQLKNPSDYTMLALSNVGDIEPELKETLLDYVSNGGNLLLAGVNVLKLFQNELQITEIIDKVPANQAMIRGGNMRALMCQDYVKVKSNAQTFAVLNEICLEGDLNCANPPPKKTVGKEYPSVIVANYGKGKIFATTFNFGLAYETERTAQLRKLMGEVISTLKLKLKVKGTHYVETVLKQNNGKTYIHLLNTAGEHRANLVKSFDEIPPIYDISVEYKTDKKPKNLILLPENKPLDFVYENGVIKTKVNKIEIHSAIEIIN